jgi:hypothetical protein
MATFIWTTFAVAIMIGIFATCVIMVAAGTRYLENALAKRRAKSLS